MTNATRYTKFRYKTISGSTRVDMSTKTKKLKGVDKIKAEQRNICNTTRVNMKSIFKIDCQKNN